MTRLGDEDKRILSDKTWLRPDEVSRVLRVSKRQVYHLVDKGALKGRREAGPLRITADSVRSVLVDD